MNVIFRSILAPIFSLLRRLQEKHAGLAISARAAEQKRQDTYRSAPYDLVAPTIEEELVVRVTGVQIMG
jgi:hypothetical protein